MGDCPTTFLTLFPLILQSKRLLLASLRFPLVNPRLPETISCQSERPPDRRSDNSLDDRLRLSGRGWAQSQAELVSGERAQIWADRLQSGLRQNSGLPAL